MSNPATEPTLQDLLAEARAMSATLTKISGILGKTASSSIGAAANSAANSATSSLSAGMSKFLPLLNPAGVALKVFTVAIQTVSKIFSVLGGLLTGIFNAAGKVASILGEFAMVASSGEMKLSNLMDVMGNLAEQIPIVGGLFSALAGGMKLLLQRQEETLEQFRKLSSVGAGIGQSLDNLRDNMRSTGLSMDEYNNVLLKNSEQFSRLGGSVDEGAKAFTKNMKAVMGEGSAVSKGFFGLGYTAEGAANSLALYMNSQGTIHKQGLQDSKAVAAGALGLAQQMTYLSEVTGKRREELEKELKEATEEANWQAFLQGLDPDAAANATAAVANGLAVAGKDGADAVKLAIQTGISTPVNEAGSRLYIATQGASQGLLKASMDIHKPIAEFSKGLDSSNYQMGKATSEFRGNLGVVNAISIAQGHELISQNAQQNANRQNQFKSEQEAIAAGEALRKKNKDAGQSTAAEIAQQTQDLKNFGNIIDSIFTTLSNAFLPGILSLTKGFTEASKDFAEWVKPKLDEFIKWLDPWIKRFTSVQSWDEFKKTVEGFWNSIKAEYEKRIGPELRELWKDVRPVLFEAIKSLFGFLWEALQSAVIPHWARGMVGPELSESEKASDRDAEIEKLKQEIIENKKNRETHPSFLPNSDLLKKEKRLAELTEEQEKYNNKDKPIVDRKSQIPSVSREAQQKFLENNKVLPLEDLKNQTDDFKKSIKQQIEIIETKAKEEETNEPITALDVTKELANGNIEPTISSKDPSEMLQQELQSLNTITKHLLSAMKESNENTRAAANILASNGNLFRR